VEQEKGEMEQEKGGMEQEKGGMEQEKGGMEQHSERNRRRRGDGKVGMEQEMRRF
jgi:hypothetical protein